MNYVFLLIFDAPVAFNVLRENIFRRGEFNLATVLNQLDALQISNDIPFPCAAGVTRHFWPNSLLPSAPWLKFVDQTSEALIARVLRVIVLISKETRKKEL